jgi:hypothetical protein
MPGTVENFRSLENIENISRLTSACLVNDQVISEPPKYFAKRYIVRLRLFFAYRKVSPIFSSLSPRMQAQYGGCPFGVRRFIATLGMRTGHNASPGRYRATRKGRTPGLAPTLVCSSRCQFWGEPGVSRPSSRGTSVPVMAGWLAGTWSK